MPARRAPAALMALLLAGPWFGLVPAWADEPPASKVAASPSPGGLSLADLAPYRAALDGKPEGPATPATFRELWQTPERFQGRRVRVEGRLVRRFRQPAFGTFPPLAENWAVTPAGDPLCLVAPDPGTLPSPDPAGPGALVQFEGVFLRLIRYRGGDTDRLAPLIVGQHAPKVVEPAPTPPRADGAGWNGFGPWEWGLGLAAVLVVGLVLFRQHLTAPIKRPRRPADDTPPEFVDDGS